MSFKPLLIDKVLHCKLFTSLFAACRNDLDGVRAEYCGALLSDVC